MKIAIITLHCSYNYGSALQAYALQSFLNKHKYEVEIIDYRSKDFDIYRLIPHRFSKGAFVQLMRTAIYFPFYYKRKNSFNNFWTKYLNLTEEVFYDSKSLIDLNKAFDIFICGSDQIWNLDCTKGVDQGFFLGFVNEGKKKIAYAPSFGKAGFKKDYSKELKYYINRLDSISVREKSTVSILQRYTTKKANVVLDPTFLLNRESYPREKPKKLQQEQKYIFMYMLGTSEEMLKYCDELSREKKLPVYYITEKKDPRFRGKLHSWTDLFGVKPEEFLYLIENASYVLSTSFHAIVFSVIFNKPFCWFSRKETGIRAEDLLNMLQLEDRIYHEAFDIDNQIDYHHVEELLNPMIDNSKEYLLGALS